MNKTLKILLVVPPQRVDFYSYLSQYKDAEYYILYYVRKNNYQDFRLPEFIKGEFFWSDYSTPYSLLDSLKPDRIVFFEIIDLRQIALIVAAHARKIKSLYLEHGAAGDKETALQRWNSSSFLKDKLPYLAKRFRKEFVDIVKSKIFYYSVVKGFDSSRSYLQYILLPFKMLQSTPNKILSRNIFKERIPDMAIVFNEINFEEFEAYTGISKKDAHLTGVPFFDKYYRNDVSDKSHVVYIEHPYLEQGLLNWDSEHHEKLARALGDFAEKRKQQIFIKLHPFSDKSIWDKYSFLNNGYVKILQAGNFDELYLEAGLILGFSSSLLTGLICAKKNIVLLGWHPSPVIFGVDFSKTGLCHLSYSPDDLNSDFDRWKSHNLTLENETAYADFLNRFNSPFDGKATKRVLKTIIEHEIY